MKLWDHQGRAVDKSMEDKRKCLALLFDPGTGKTFTTIAIILEKWNRDGHGSPVLIFCPPVVIENWRREWMRFAGLAENRILPLVGSQKERIKLLEKPFPASVFITNYESLIMDDLFAVMKDYFGRYKPGTSTLVLDESHKVKDIKSKRTKRVIELSDTFDHKYILTGTPVLKSYLDVFTQFRVLDKNIFGTNYFSFRGKYFYDKNSGMPSHKHFPDFRMHEFGEKEIKRLVDENSCFAKKEDCLDLPPLVKVRVEVELGKEQRRVYDSMKKDFLAVIGDRVALAELVVTNRIRMLQIVSGHIKVQNDDGTTTALQIKDNPRKDALKQLLEDLTPAHKVIVWAVYRDNYQDIREVCDSLGIKYVEITGDTVDKQGSVDEFTNDPDCRVCIGHPGAGGIGINITAASYSIYYSRTDSLEHDVQSEARNYRGGSEIHEKVTRIDLVAPGTIDDLVLKNLAAKQVLSDNILIDNIKEIFK